MKNSIETLKNLKVSGLFWYQTSELHLKTTIEKQVFVGIS